MSYLVVSPQLVASAATDFIGISSALSSANASAAAATTQVLAAAGDEVSAAVAAAFEAYGQQYQVLSAQMAAFQDEFARMIAGSANAYATAETSSVEQLVLGVDQRTHAGPVGAAVDRGRCGGDHAGCPGR